jgi:hypothetical protein
MKTEEDEAFDDLAKKQGDWGGGFKAKQAMAADKLHWSDCAVHNAPAYPAGKCDCGVAQEPVAWMDADERQSFERFNETCADGEGYDVPKPMMRRLAEIGVIYHMSRGIYGITEFGLSLLATPPQRERVLFPTMLRKMWSGGEVQAWLDENVNKEQNNG